MSGVPSSAGSMRKQNCARHTKSCAQPSRRCATLSRCARRARFTLDPAQVAAHRPPAVRLGWRRWLQVVGVFAGVLIAAIGVLNVLGSMGAGAPQMAAQPTAPAAEPMLAAVPTEPPTVAAEARESAQYPTGTATPQRGDTAAAPSTLDNGSEPGAPQALATVIITPEVATLPEVLPQPTIAPPAISSPGTVDLAQPTPIADSSTPGGVPRSDAFTGCGCDRGTGRRRRSALETRQGSGLSVRY